MPQHSPPLTDPISSVIEAYNHALGQARTHTADVLPTAHTRGELTTPAIYAHHPSAREDLQSPFVLRPIGTADPVTIHNFYITGVYSDTDPVDSTFQIYSYLDVDAISMDTVGTAPYTLIHDQLRQMEQQVTPLINTFGLLPTQVYPHTGTPRSSLTTPPLSPLRPWM